MSRHGLFVRRLSLGIVALMLWLAFFCGGLLIETVEYRVFLAPHSFPKHAEADKEAGIVATPYTGDPTYAFFAAALWFTPTNLAFLALLAGLLGGCASNILVDRLNPEQAERIEPARMRYLAETPWSAMMRSFLVFLCVIAGLYFAIDDPFKNSTPSQYMRLAGTISVLAFLVGYDPTRIRAWIGLVPSPPSQKVTVTEDVRHSVTVEKQGSGAVQELLIRADSQNGDHDSEKVSDGMPIKAEAGKAK